MNQTPFIIAVEEALRKGLPTVAEKGKAMLEDFTKVIIPAAVEEGKKTLLEIKEDTQKAWDDFKKKIQEEGNPDHLVFEEVDILDSQKLLDFAKKYNVKDANEVYAMKKQKKTACFVYLSYGKDRNLFEKEQNKYVIIKAGALTADVLGLFDESELVILK